MSFLGRSKAIIPKPHRASHLSSKALYGKSRLFSAWASEMVGVPETTEYRVFTKLQSKANRVSPWHDIPLLSQSNKKLFHYVNEIPKGTRAKFEIATKEKYNPIKQDIKKEKLRFFLYGDIPFNYGAFPQTWEDPNSKHPDTQFGGDNDPIDVVELSPTPIQMGNVSVVKILGILAMIDEGETDWKVIAISEANPLFNQIHRISDIEQHLPGKLNSVKDWFRNYKVPDGKPQNKFALNEQYQDENYANKVIEEAHNSWKDLVSKKIPKGKLWIPE